MKEDKRSGRWTQHPTTRRETRRERRETRPRED
jgi:hypothetical protein